MRFLKDKDSDNEAIHLCCKLVLVNKNTDMSEKNKNKKVHHVWFLFIKNSNFLNLETLRILGLKIIHLFKYFILLLQSLVERLK